MKRTAFYIFVLTLLTLSFVGLVKLNKLNTNLVKNNSSEVSVSQQINENTRKPAVSGSFYPSDKNELQREIDDLLGQSPTLKFDEKVRILIVPHAGIKYSGLVSAYGFNQLINESYERVILLGSSHNNRYDYFAVDDSLYWETPLGKVSVDKEFISTLVNDRSIVADKTPHIKEHSLEMELIFLQRVLSDFKIVPILAGQVDEYLISQLAQKLAYNIDEDTLFVVSSDLSHYPDWETANFVDKRVIESILSGKRNKFEKTIYDINSEDHSNLETAACAQNAISVVLEMDEFLGISKYDKLKYINSGDVTDDKKRVVGYVSIVARSSALQKYIPELDEATQKEALDIARYTLEKYLTNKDYGDIDYSSEMLEQPLGVFVTLTKNGNLRGCIGDFEPVRPLYKVIQETVVKSATKDFRFNPLTYEELKDINIEISVMTPKKIVEKWQDIRIGKDGVVVKKDLRFGTFLPQVAADNNWGLEKFLSELCTQKVGLGTDCYKDPDSKLYSFEVQRFSE